MRSPWGTGRALFLLLWLLAPDALGQPASFNVVLPEEGTAGLEAGAEVQVLGLRAGTVQRIAFGAQRLVAEIRIEQPEARGFIRADSPVTIRERPGRAAVLFIGRGTGAVLAPGASLEATAAPGVEAQMLAVVEQLRGDAAPVLRDMGRLSRFASGVLDQAERGRGGALPADQGFAEDITALLRGGAQLVQRLDRIAAQAERLMAEQGGAGGSMPQLMRRMDQSLASLQQATRDVQRATARLPQTVRNIEEGTGGVPALLLQTQQTTRELELLLAQLRGMWLLGGSGPPAPEPTRPASERLRP
jgi:phospholipid/cholesterol/gamma-HCH transport system substrate-binding protein